MHVKRAHKRGASVKTTIKKRGRYHLKGRATIFGGRRHHLEEALPLRRALPSLRVLAY